MGSLRTGRLARRRWSAGWFAGTQGRRHVVTHRGRTQRHGARLARRDVRSPGERIRRDLVASRAINWGNDPFARGAYSYATPKTREALAMLRPSASDGIFFSGEALYAGPDMGDCRGGVGQRSRDGVNNPERIPGGTTLGPVASCSRSRPRFWTTHDKPFRTLDPCPRHT